MNPSWRTIAAILACFYAGLVEADEPKKVPFEKVGSEFLILGKTHQPLGELVTLKGVVVEGDTKGYEDGLNIKVQRINGKETQEKVQIRLRPYLGSTYDEKVTNSLKPGQSYELRGYEEMDCVGIPDKAYKEAGITAQTRSFYYRVTFVVVKAKVIVETKKK
jgi:hypothetical protein